MKKYTDGKNMPTTKMREALASKGVADTGRLSSTVIQTETKANWQYFSQWIPADCWVWIYVMPFDAIERKLITFLFVKLVVLKITERR